MLLHNQYEYRRMTMSRDAYRKISCVSANLVCARLALPSMFVQDIVTLVPFLPAGEYSQ